MSGGPPVVNINSLATEFASPSRKERSRLGNESFHALPLRRDARNSRIPSELITRERRKKSRVPTNSAPSPPPPPRMGERFRCARARQHRRLLRVFGAIQNPARGIPRLNARAAARGAPVLRPSRMWCTTELYCSLNCNLRRIYALAHIISIMPVSKPNYYASEF